MSNEWFRACLMGNPCQDPEIIHSPGCLCPLSTKQHLDQHGYNWMLLIIPLRQGGGWNYRISSAGGLKIKAISFKLFRHSGCYIEPWVRLVKRQQMSLCKVHNNALMRLTDDVNSISVYKGQYLCISLYYYEQLFRSYCLLPSYFSIAPYSNSEIFYLIFTRF